jgi:uncharacterized protein (UPF0276 family)
MTGFTFTAAHAPWLETGRANADCLEIPASWFYSGAQKILDSLAETWPLVVSRGALSLGSPGRIEGWRLDSYARIVERSRARWVSESLAFTETEEFRLGVELPVYFSKERAAGVVARIQQVQERCQIPFLLQVPGARLSYATGRRQAAFVQAICEGAGCGMALDLTALWLQSGKRPEGVWAWLDEVDGAKIRQIQLSGYSQRGRLPVQDKAGKVAEEVWDVTAEVLRRVRPELALLQREASYGSAVEFAGELQRLRRLQKGGA